MTGAHASVFGVARRVGARHRHAAGRRFSARRGAARGGFGAGMAPHHGAAAGRWQATAASAHEDERMLLVSLCICSSSMPTSRANGFSLRRVSAAASPLRCCVVTRPSGPLLDTLWSTERGRTASGIEARSRARVTGSVNGLAFLAVSVIVSSALAAVPILSLSNPMDGRIRHADAGMRDAVQ